MHGWVHPWVHWLVHGRVGAQVPWLVQEWACGCAGAWADAGIGE